MGELMAVLDLFNSTAHVSDEPLHILCDSQYVINAITKWMPGWKRKGWRKADGKPVLNLDLLKEIDAAIVGRKYTFEWVKGHAGHDLNEAADDRARDAATAYQAKRTPQAGPGFPGAHPPEVLEADDDASSATSQESASKLPPTTAAALWDESEQHDLFSMLEDDPDPAFNEHHDASVESVIGLERELQNPAVRADPLRAAELLHPDFEEIGASGRRWSRQDLLEMLGNEEPSTVDLEVLTLNRLGSDTALLTYRSVAPAGSSLRSSLWQQDHGQWRLRFHQGTPEA